VQLPVNADRFEEVVRTRDRLRQLNKPPSHRASSKVIDHIDEICQRFIAACPFVIVATRGADGRLDLSPKGDPPGFVAVVNKKTLAVPDRLGNNRLDTFENLLVHPEVGLFFIIPGNGDTLREVHGPVEAVGARPLAGPRRCSHARRGYGDARCAFRIVN
jgi:uncharacterized protein